MRDLKWLVTLSDGVELEITGRLSKEQACGAAIDYMDRTERRGRTVAMVRRG